MTDLLTGTGWRGRVVVAAASVTPNTSYTPDPVGISLPTNHAGVGKFFFSAEKTAGGAIDSGDTLSIVCYTNSGGSEYPFVSSGASINFLADYVGDTIVAIIEAIELAPLMSFTLTGGGTDVWTITEAGFTWA